MTYRYYLQDAHFAVIQELDSTMAGLLEKALQAPVYDIFLGRKNCIPSDFIYKGIYDSYQEAVESAFIIAESKKLSACFKVEEGQHEGEQIVLQDVPVQFGEWKQYRDRTVTIIPL
jgi:CRISPR system Cascade subunit CasD